jgi:hypothetical protein
MLMKWVSLEAGSALAGVHLSRLVVYGLPVAFVVISWLVSAGFPYYLDSNESFLSYLHARNLEIWNPDEYGWLTAHGTDPQQPTTEFVYAHNPNAPRYLNYLLLRAGIRDLPQHVLILSLACTSLAVWLLWRVFADPALVVVPLAVVFDYTGFLSWTVNTYRMWTFVLFFGLVLAVVARRPLWAGVLMFLLFQVEYGMALFVGMTAVMLALLTHRRRAWPLLLATGLGAVLSVGAFGIQVLAYYGWDGLLNELAVTYVRRGTVGESGGGARYLYQAWNGPVLLLTQVALGTYNLAVLVMVLKGVVSSVVALRRGSLSDAHRFVGNLTVATTVSMIATSTVLYGYFVDGFVLSMLPLTTFLIAPALGIVALELRAILGRLSSWPQLTMLSTVVVLAPLVAASITHFRPPIAVELFHRLQTEYRGKTIVGPNPGAWQMNPALAFALTGGRAVPTSDIDATPDDVRRFEALRGADGSLTYVCLDTLYLRDGPNPARRSTCDVAVDRMVPRGHQIMAQGNGWAIIQVAREE